MKYIFLILGLVSIVGTTDAMHVKSKNFGGKKNTGSKPFRAPKIKTQAPAKKSKQPAAQVKQDDGKFPVIPENKKPAQVASQIAPTEEQAKQAQEQIGHFVWLCTKMELCVSKDVEEILMWARQHVIVEQAFKNPEDLERLLQEKFIQAVQADNIDLVHFLLLELNSDAKQTGSLIYPQTIKKSGVYEWVYQTIDKEMEQEASKKLYAILEHVKAIMPANNAQEQEILAQDEEVLNKALQNLVFFLAKERRLL